MVMMNNCLDIDIRPFQTVHSQYPQCNYTCSCHLVMNPEKSNDNFMHTKVNVKCAQDILLFRQDNLYMSSYVPLESFWNVM